MIGTRAIMGVLERIGLIVTTSFILPSIAFADERPITIAVDYHPGEGCLEEEQFTPQLQARMPRVQRVEGDGATLSFRIYFVESGGGLIGHFEMRGSDGTLTQRTIPPASCSESVTAMALIAAVLVDPNTAALAPASKPPVIAPSQTKKNGSQRVSEAVSRLEYQAGVGGIWEGAVVPGVAFGLSVEVGATLNTHQMFSPSLFGALLRTFPVHVDSTARGTARFEWTAFRLMASPLKWPVRGVVALRPAVFFDFGKLEASGERTENTKSTEITWSAMGALLRLDMTPMQRLSIVLDGGMVIPLRHDRFYFAPNDGSASVFTVPRADLTARLGVAAHF